MNDGLKELTRGFYSRAVRDWKLAQSGIAPMEFKEIGRDRESTFAQVNISDGEKSLVVNTYLADQHQDFSKEGDKQFWANMEYQIYHEVGHLKQDTVFGKAHHEGPYVLHTIVPEGSPVFGFAYNMYVELTNEYSTISLLCDRIGRKGLYELHKGFAVGFIGSMLKHADKNAMKGLIMHRWPYLFGNRFHHEGRQFYKDMMALVYHQAKHRLYDHEAFSRFRGAIENAEHELRHIHLKEKTDGVYYLAHKFLESEKDLVKHLVEVAQSLDAATPAERREL
ncbi:MAG: hypothetical protein ABH829_01330 [archaeon]